MRHLKTERGGYFSPIVEVVSTIADEPFATSRNMDANGRHEAYNIDANEFEW